jgi:hypothetical protein
MLKLSFLNSLALVRLRFGWQFDNEYSGFGVVEYNNTLVTIMSML